MSTYPQAEHTAGLLEQVFVRKVIELHEKYMAYVNDCFGNHTLFHQALKKAFEIFCNKQVAGSLSAELLASFVIIFSRRSCLLILVIKTFLLNSIDPSPPVDERKKLVEDVDKDRRYAIDASTVRIMKSRKVLGHQQLVMECVEQLSCMFKPDFKAIKKRIEDLITRDYLERDNKNSNLFRYLA
ncbi:cullin-1-like [Actinidia eriantha]|uniref:cullin-1-like n=1 Tax=Actinidia eriantha TaxID=165200 RepID=UPI00258AFAF2|nr:cullin-1-like [Actinidia eriantha]